MSLSGIPKMWELVVRTGLGACTRCDCDYSSTGDCMCSDYQACDAMSSESNLVKKGAESNHSTCNSESHLRPNQQPQPAKAKGTALPLVDAQSMVLKRSQHVSSPVTPCRKYKLTAMHDLQSAAIAKLAHQHGEPTSVDGLRDVRMLTLAQQPLLASNDLVSRRHSGPNHLWTPRA